MRIKEFLPGEGDNRLVITQFGVMFIVLSNTKHLSKSNKVKKY